MWQGKVYTGSEEQNPHCQLRNSVSQVVVTLKIVLVIYVMFIIPARSDYHHFS